ncbi:putative reverse transcriptase, RNA-dependent DNA polymerase [Tanacetum coccineum]
MLTRVLRIILVVLPEHPSDTKVFIVKIEILLEPTSNKLLVGTQSNDFAGIKASDNASQARKETEPVKGYILLPLWTADPPYSQDPKTSHDDGSKTSKKEDNVNSTNSVNAASTNEVNAIGGKTSIELPFDPNMPALENYIIFDFSRNDEDDSVEADMNNLDTTIQVRRTQKGNSYIEGSKLDRGYAGRAYTIQVTKKFQTLWIYNEKRAIVTKWVFRNKKDERGIVIRNKARLVAQGYTQEEGIDYDEVFALVARIEAIRLFLAYASFKDFVVYQMDVKSDFLYGKIEEEVYVCQPPRFKDPDFPDRVYKVEKALYGLHQAPKAWYETLSTYLLEIDEFYGRTYILLGITKVKTASIPIETSKASTKDVNGVEVDVQMFVHDGSLMYLTSSRPDIMFAVCACARYQVNPKVSHLHDVKRIFRYLKGQPKLSLWYPKDSPFDLVAYTNSDYAGASLDRKSTTGGCQFLGCRLISWQCKKQTVVANSITEAEYVAASSCCGQVLWIQNQLLDYGYNFMHTKIFIDNNSTICIIKNPVFHSKTKHIEIIHHFIRDCNEKKLIQMVKIHTDKNVADLLTKAFDVSRFQYLIASIGMLNL